MNEYKSKSERAQNDCAQVLYVHGKGGSASEAEHYKALFPDCDVIGLDYRAQTPWEAREEFPIELERQAFPFGRIILIANSIGAYFSMCAMPQERIERAYFVSPVTDMEKLICDMMRWADVSEDELRERNTIETSFGETLSWEYLSYVRANAPSWNVKTQILYGGGDGLVSRDTVFDFAKEHGAELTVMENGEHWFHTPEQMTFLDEWIRQCESACNKQD